MVLEWPFGPILDHLDPFLDSNIYRNTLAPVPKPVRVDPNGPKWTQMDPDGPRWTQTPAKAPPGAPSNWAWSPVQLSRWLAHARENITSIKKEILKIDNAQWTHTITGE